MSIYWLAEYPRQVGKLGMLYQKYNGGLVTAKSSILSSYLLKTQIGHLQLVSIYCRLSSKLIQAN